MTRMPAHYRLLRALYRLLLLMALVLMLLPLLQKAFAGGAA